MLQMVVGQVCNVLVVEIIPMPNIENFIVQDVESMVMLKPDVLGHLVHHTTMFLHIIIQLHILVHHAEGLVKLLPEAQVILVHMAIHHLIR